MLKSAFLHDTDIDFKGGAETSVRAVLDVAEQMEVLAVFDNLTDFRLSQKLISESDFVIINSTFRCPYEFLLFDFLIASGKPYIKWEHDYNFCEKRNALCFADMNVKGCCNRDRFSAYRKLFKHAALSVFKSPGHCKIHQEIYGEAIGPYLTLPALLDVSDLKSSVKKENTVCYSGDLTLMKGGHELLDFAMSYPQMQIEVFGENKLEREIPANVLLKGNRPRPEVLEALSTAEYLFLKPRYPEPGSRVAVEAFLSGCKTISNEREGFHSQPYYPAYPEDARNAIQNAPHLFWEKVKEAVQNNPKIKTHWKNVLIYKSFGGLGDFLFAIPAIKKIADVSDKVSVCVPAVIFDFIKKRFVEFEILPEEYICEARLSDYDKVIDLKNYPTFKKDEGNPHQMSFPSYRRLNQHALYHYLDSVSTLHPEIDTSYRGFPYFKKEVIAKSKYFTLHAGAGFAAKLYPGKYFGQLVEMLLALFKDLECKIISGPDDPKAEDLFDKIPERVTQLEGKLEAITDVISGAIFHIGNDSGITHLAGAFNIPTVSIHGPTGPGTWASFAEQAQVIWGKQGVCHIACNYDISINCEHRICLHSVSPQRVLKHVLKLLRSILPWRGNKRFVLNPEAEVENNDNAFIVTLHKNELLVEFSDSSEKVLFQKLINNRLWAGSYSESFESLLDLFIQQELLFEIPDFGSVNSNDPIEESIDITIISHVYSRDGIGRHGIIFGEILQDAFTINGVATRQPNSLDIDPALFKKLTTKNVTGKLVIYTDVLWHNKKFEPYRLVSSNADLKICYSMFESSAIPAEWAGIINSVFDGVLVPDPWLATVYKNSGVTKPVKVLPLACYLEDFLVEPVKERAGDIFTFGISSAIWMRKNIAGVIKAFKSAFSGKENVKLRIHSRYGLAAEVEQINRAIQSDPRIDFFVEALSPADYVSFMSSLDAYVFLSMGEGFSVTPREAMALGLPVILSDNSVHRTICESGLVYPVSTEMEIPAYYEAFNGVHGNYFMPDLKQAAQRMREVFEQRETIYADAVKRRKWAARYDVSNMKEEYINTIRKILAEGFHENS